MTDASPEEARPSRGTGDRRDGDRRRRDRRKSDRRTPPPPWRRPWAFVAYGVVAALALVLVLDGGDEPEPVLSDAQVITGQGPPTVVRDTVLPGAGQPVERLATAPEFERLIAQGEDAVGRRVRTELFCGTLGRIGLRDIERAVNPSVAALADARGELPAAECRWGPSEQGVNQDFLLLVPPELAAEFASAPIVRQGFIDRRYVPAEVEWVGRSEALSLRVAAVLREVLPADALR